MLYSIITRWACLNDDDGLTRKTTIHGWLVANHRMKSTGHAAMRTTQRSEWRAAVSTARTARYHRGMYATYSFCRSLYRAHSSRIERTTRTTATRTYACHESDHSNSHSCPHREKGSDSIGNSIVVNVSASDQSTSHSTSKRVKWLHSHTRRPLPSTPAAAHPEPSNPALSFHHAHCSTRPHVAP